MEYYLALLQPWHKAILIFIGFSIIRFVYKKFALEMARKLTGILNLILIEDLISGFEQPINCMLWIWNFSFALDASPLNTEWLVNFLNHFMRSALVFCFFWGIYNVTYTTHGVLLRLIERLGLKAEPAINNLFSTVIHIFVILIGFAAIAKEWNYDVTGFLASLSIGSVAVAFAAKDTLANVFGSLVIILDKPFKEGDWISVNGTEGVVEKISFRSTSVRTFPGELVYIPNNLLSNVHITNFEARTRARVDFELGFMYDTSKEKMDELIDAIKSFLQSKTDCLYPETIEVNFVGYGTSSLNVRIIYYAVAKGGAELRSCQNAINLGLLEVIEKVGVSCAFPSTSVYFENAVEVKQTEKS